MQLVLMYSTTTSEILIISHLPNISGSRLNHLRYFYSVYCFVINVENVGTYLNSADFFLVSTFAGDCLT